MTKNLLDVVGKLLRLSAFVNNALHRCGHGKHIIFMSNCSLLI